MSEARCDLSPVLAAAIRPKLSDPEKVQLLWWCGGVLWPEARGWVLRFERGDRISGADRQRVLEQGLDFLLVSPDLWPLVEEAS